MNKAYEENMKAREALKPYINFMYNEDNIDNCSCCPENNGMENCSRPCGQQNCWVAVHCGHAK